MIDLNYIFKDGDKFIIRKDFEGRHYYFGDFDNLDDAILKRDLLDGDGWPIPINLDEDSKSSESDVDVSFKVGSSYKHGFLVLTRNETFNIIPKLPYEDECDVILDGMYTKIKLNVLLRLTIPKRNKELRDYLKKLSDSNPNQRKLIKILLNKEDENPLNFDNLIRENEMLKKDLFLANMK